LTWFANWADAAALTGDVNFEGHVTRKVLFSGIALSFLRIKDEPSLNAADLANAKAWICRVGTILHTEHTTTYASYKSNQMYMAVEFINNV